MFTSSKDTGKERDMYLKSASIIVMSDTDINELFKIILSCTLSEYKNNLLEKMKVSEFFLIISIEYFLVFIRSL